jgi:uncharacterized protein (TIGR03790 family)
MVNRTRATLLLLIVLLFTSTFTACGDQQLANVTIVVFNSNDPQSAELAKFYAKQRNIPRDNLVGIACSKEEEISREEYDKTIARPLREIFRKRKWWSVRDGSPPVVSSMKIRFVAVIKGVPLKIRPAEKHPGDKPQPGPVGERNDASVDSELALLARHAPEISGAIVNPYFKSFRRFTEGEPLPILLVCRLDAPDSATVRRMITDAIETEKRGLWGRAFVDGAGNTGGGLLMGDEWLKEIVQQLRKSGVPVVYDNEGPMFAEGYPMGEPALYYGWYSHGLAGNFVDPAFRFRPGAVAVHIHSFSAATLRDPNANWAAPLLVRGAAATVGNVYEPYLQLTPHLNILNERLLNGFTFAESAYMAAPALSWMTVMLGDPLYKPYAAWQQLDLPRDPDAADWRMYREFTLANIAKPADEFRKLAREAASKANNGPMIEDLGLLEAQDGKWLSAASHFQQARSIYTKRDDILRAVLHEANAWKQAGQPKRGLQAVQSVLRIVSDPATIALFKQVESDLGK